MAGTADVHATYPVTAWSWSDGGRVIYVAGVDEAGKSVFEVFEFEPVPGSWQPGPVPKREALGVEVAPALPSVRLEGDVFIPPSERPRSRFEHRRTRLFRDLDIGHIQALGADPEGGFLLALSKERGELLLLDLNDDRAPVVWLDVDEAPELASVTEIEARQHASDGRKYVLSCVEMCIVIADAVIVLDDPNNDGHLDSHSVLTCEGFDRRYPTSSWTTLTHVDPMPEIPGFEDGTIVEVR